MGGFDTLEGDIWMNGEWVKGTDAKIHVLSHGLHYASSVFEGERAYNGKIFRLADHGKRLICSAEIMMIDVPYSAPELDAVAEDIIKRNNHATSYIRRFAWRGSGQMEIAAQNSGLSIAVASWPWPSYFNPELMNSGLSLKTSRWRRPDPRTAPHNAKTGSLYAICTLSKHEAQDAGYTDALMLDHEGYVAESTGSNIFMILNGELHTPTADRFLNGLTRQTIIDIAKDLGFVVVERRISPEELSQASEIFLTGTAAEVMPVGKIDEKSFQVGSATRQLRDAYLTQVGA